MFSKSSNKLPKKIEFSLTPEQYLEDIEAIASSEENRKLLYLCIESKVPKPDSRLNKMEDFLKDNVDLEHAVRDLDKKCEELRKHKAELLKDKEEILEMINKQA